MTWLLVLLAAFALLGTRRPPPRVDVHLLAFAMIVVGVGLKTLSFHLS